jgi:hypothetical protein
MKREKCISVGEGKVTVSLMVYVFEVQSGKKAKLTWCVREGLSLVA